MRAKSQRYGVGVNVGVEVGVALGAAVNVLLGGSVGTSGTGVLVNLIGVNVSEGGNRKT